MRLLNFLLTGLLLLPTAVTAGDRPVNITPNMPHVEAEHEGKTVRIQRVPDNRNRIDPNYALTSRPCPPFCIQPKRLAEGVETVGELEVLNYLRRVTGGDESVMVVDSRTPDWLARGMIPGAVNVPYTRLRLGRTDSEEIVSILSFDFGAESEDGLWDFRNAKTLVLYCNGPWCGQSPMSIRSLLILGYPPHKLKWYRGGMQAWKSFGLTVVTPGGSKNK